MKLNPILVLASTVLRVSKPMLRTSCLCVFAKLHNKQTQLCGGFFWLPMSGSCSSGVIVIPLSQLCPSLVLRYKRIGHASDIRGMKPSFRFSTLVVSLDFLPHIRYTTALHFVMPPLLMLDFLFGDGSEYFPFIICGNHPLFMTLTNTRRHEDDEFEHVMAR
ncbi:hypothetical protein RSAG8_03765, partial [Rhizoctonia solani AG-8 WAC10335]